jgi:hypothetical protein
MCRFRVILPAAKSFGQCVTPVAAGEPPLGREQGHRVSPPRRRATARRNRPLRGSPEEG